MTAGFVFMAITLIGNKGMHGRRYALFFLTFASLTTCTKEARLTLPEPVTNNAAAALKKEDRDVAYSFYGLDSTLQADGVHNKVFRADLQTGGSTFVGNIPDLGRLASSASVINNKAYVVGGYAVLANGKEKSSDNVFIFDPATEQFTRGATLPIPIDDHVQDVWRNTLLYVISGWTDSLNTNAVQVYDPAANAWQLATPLPDEPDAKVFGACGLIAGDTIYVLGGATFAKYYPPSRTIYKGAIDPANPLRITWINAGEYPGEFRYRAAAFRQGDDIIVAGGSNETYNYNALAYDGGNPVAPNATSLIYSMQTGGFTVRPSEISAMDLRNVAIMGDGNVWLVGGMEAGRRVTARIRKAVTSDQ